MTRAQELAVLHPVFLRGDRIVRLATLIHLGLALAIAPVYDTWLIALPVGVLATAMFWLCAKLLPGHFLTRVVGGIALQVFCALHIFQLHGMPEMHFFFFTSFTLMIFYKDSRAMWPGAALIIAQHILFAALHNSGVELFFFEQARVGVLKLLFHFGIAIADVIIAGVVAESLRERTLKDFERAEAIATQLKATTALMAELQTTRDRLVQTEKLATAGTLAAGVGHEINNPLAFVTGNLEHLRLRFDAERDTLSKLPDFADLRDCVLEASEGATRIAAIVRDLKTFARGNDTLIGPVDAQASLEFALSMAAPEIRHRAVVVRDYQPLPPVEANDTKLGQVFLVLLVNAAQALKEGGAAEGRITVRTRVEGTKVRISVEDTGPGIPETNLARIFDPFFTTKPVGEGTGLGLSIASNIVTALGGTIEVDSPAGQGAKFHVLLNTTNGQPRAMRTGKTPNQLIAAQSPARVLVIDDEPDMSGLVARLLGPSVTVQGALSGREGLLLLEHERFDLVLCDVMMPDVSGPEVRRTIQRRWPQMLPRVVMMTGGAFTEESQRFLDSLPEQVLEKPFSAERLRSLLLARRKAG